MIVSPIITPFRWYNKFYDQTQYDVDCSNDCEFKLITDRGHLLPFQFKREASLSLIDKWILRRSCDAAEPKLLSPENSIFYGEYENNWEINGDNCDVRTIHTGADRTLSDNSVRTLGVYYCNTTDKQCNILRSGSTNAATGVLPNILTPGKKYRFHVTIGDISLITGSNLYIKFLDGITILLDNVNSLGYYEVEFIATGTDFSFVVVADITVDVTDYIGIEEIQIVELFSQNVNDIVLNKSLLKLKNAGSTDYFIYCGNDLGISLPTGDYYSIITTYDELIYYSEIITIKSFIPEKSKFYKLEWFNECDIQDVIYQPVGDPSCNYKNRLYFDEAVITKPEYPFKEEVQTDGNNDNIPVFQKWEKDIQFIIGKCPEFIVDSLTAIRLHDNIYVTRPLRNEQLQALQPLTIKTIEYDVAYIINDCFANVSLKMLIEDKYIDSACCSNNIITPCETCDYTVTRPINDFSPSVDLDFAFAFEGENANGLYQYNGGLEEWEVFPTLNETIVCVQGQVFILLVSIDDWVLIPKIFSVVHTSSPSSFNIQGYSYPNSYIQIEVSLDMGATWVADSQIISNVQFELAGVDIPLATEPEIWFRAHNFTLNCDYGYSNISIFYE